MSLKSIDSGLVVVEMYLRTVSVAGNEPDAAAGQVLCYQIKLDFASFSLSLLQDAAHPPVT